MSKVTDNIGTLLKDVCRTEAVCGTCEGANCPVGFAKQICKQSADLKPPHVKGAAEATPKYSSPGAFDEDIVLTLLANTLLECKACKDNHTDDCVLAVARHACEVIEFSEHIEYDGNPLSYMVKVNEENPIKGDALREIYEKEKAIKID